MNSNMNDHAEKLKNGIKILENKENECKKMVESARSQHKKAIEKLEKEKMNLQIVNMKLNKMMDFLKPYLKRQTSIFYIKAVQCV